MGSHTVLCQFKVMALSAGVYKAIEFAYDYLLVVHNIGHSS